MKFKANSQNAEILAILTAGNSLTHHKAAQMGIMGFTARIQELRNAGYNIACVMEKHTNKHGKTIKRGRFSLIKGGSHE